MTRPTFLVLETEPEHALSARKLVLETAKFNVITAHSWKEGRGLMQKFPKVEAVIVSAEITNCGSCHDFIRDVKKQNSDLPVMVLAPNDSDMFEHADYRLPSHEPELLVTFLRERFGDPRTMPTPSQLAD